MTYSTVERTSATQVTITTRVPYPELELMLPKAVAKISEETEIEGFRKGKASYEVVKQKVGEFKVLEEAARIYIEKNFEKILEDIENREYRGKSFEPIGQPQVAITKLALPNFAQQNLGGRAPGLPSQVSASETWKGGELEFKITLAILPPIELPDYKAIAQRVLAQKRVPEVTEKEVKSNLDWLRESRAKLVTVSREAGIGDRVEIDFTSKLDGVALEGGRSENHPFILGKGRFVPGFEEELLGLKAGDEKSFTLAVPQDWRDQTVAGKAIEFAAKMKIVQERQVPEWNDALAKSLGEFSSTVEVEKSVRDGLHMEKEIKERERLRMRMLEEIAAETRAEIPETLIERELEKMVRELAESIGRMGMEFSSYLAGIKKTEADLKREWREDAARRVKIALVLREISRREAIQPSGEEVRETINRTVERLGIAEEKLKGVDREAFLDYNRGIARNEKVLQWLENLESRNENRE